MTALIGTRCVSVRTGVEMRWITLLLLGSLGAHVQAANIYRWVDEQGRIHYGDAIPMSYEAKGRSIEVKSSEVTDAQRQDAAERVAKERDTVEALARARQALTSNASAKATVPIGSGKANDGGGCEQEWRRYRESQACLAPFRTATGAIKVEAFEHCLQLKQPAACK